MLDDASELLVGARKESWHVGESHNRNLECVAESDEASSFHRCVDVEDTGQYRRLVCNHANHSAFNLGEACDDVFGKAWHNLVELVSVAHAFNNCEHIVGLVWVMRHNVVK